MNFNLSLSQEHAQIVIAALNDGPFRVVAPVISDIQAQINAQLNPPSPDKAPAAS